MRELPCHLLGIYPSDGWLVAFDDPARGLDYGSPCYIPAEAVYGFTPEPGSATEYAPGIIRIADVLWENMHNRIARVMKERPRVEAAERRAQRKKSEKFPSVARRDEDRMLRSRNAKKRRETTDNRQNDMFLKRD